MLRSRLAEDKEGSLVSLGTPLQHVHQVTVRVILNPLSIHLQQDISLTKLGTARVVHDKLHHWTYLGFTCVCVHVWRSHDSHMTGLHIIHTQRFSKKTLQHKSENRSHLIGQFNYHVMTTFTDAGTWKTATTCTVEIT